MRHDGAVWRGFAALFGFGTALLATILFLFVLALDPYGLRAAPGRSLGPIMDPNQRFMYPQIVRSGRFDAAVFGTSTIRLLDPNALSEAFGGRFANLGLNAGTPWEQREIAALFLRKVPRPRALIFGLDPTWCEADADGSAKRLTARAFPPWLYEDDRPADLPNLLNLRSVEIAGRVLLHKLGLLPERIRSDGYEVFVPPEARYDLARARFHIWHGRGPGIEPVSPPVRLSGAERAGLRFPGLAWLDDLLGRVPSESLRVLAFMPVHVAAQARPGSFEAEREAECKDRVAAIGRRRGATVVDFHLASPVTEDDANYWDGLHYRVGVADRIVVSLKQAVERGTDDPDGFFRVLAHR